MQTLLTWPGEEIFRLGGATRRRYPVWSEGPDLDARELLESSSRVVKTARIDERALHVGKEEATLGQSSRNDCLGTRAGVGAVFYGGCDILVIIERY